MKIIFMGTPDFSVGTLEALIEAGHEVVLAVTQPDKPKGRGKEMQFTPVKHCAIEHNIPVFQPLKVRDKDCIEYLKSFQADIMVVIAFGQILPKEILELTPYGCVNVHASLLPKYRGAAPLQWSIIDGEEVTGITTMQMDVGLDTGDMLLKVEVPLDKKETYGSLHDKMAEAGAKLCVETLVGLENKSIVPEQQGEMTTDYAKMIHKSLGDIDWSQDAVVIERLIRGLNPWPSAYTNWNDKVMKIWDAEVAEDIVNDENEGYKMGTIISMDKKSFSVKTGKGILQILEVQVPGKKRMDAGAFLRGNQVEIGCELGR
ncbi:MAG: methionyl-tRNA formyltransferase [Eubacteriales bacterium]